MADVYARLESRQQSPDGTEQWLNWALIAADGQPLGLLHHLGFEVASNVTAQAHTLTPTEVLLERKLPAQPTWPEP